MNSLADYVWSLLARLYHGDSASSLYGSMSELPHGDAATLTKQIDAAKGMASVPALAALLYRGNSYSREAIRRIIGKCHPLELAQLDQMVREVGEWRAPQVRPADVAGLAGGLTETLAIFSFHSSGYVREEATLLLGRVQDGSELPFLLLRLNDWVLKVRWWAEDAIRDRLRSDYAAHFARVLPLVDRLRKQGRADHTPIVDAITALLQEESSRPALRAALLSSDRHTARAAFRLLAAIADPVPLLDNALQAGDTVVRLWAARELRRRLESDALYRMLERLAVDSFMPVCREGLYGLAEQFPERSRDRLVVWLFDARMPIREAARFYLRKAGIDDFASIYRDRLQTSDVANQTGAISGLAETGEKADAQLLRSYVSHPMARVRRAAIRALGHLDPDSFRDDITNALRDSVPMVAKAARDIVQTHLYLLNAKQLSEMFQASNNVHQKLYLLAIMASLAWWESAPLLVTATGESDSQVRARAADYLWRWERNRGRLNSHPTHEQAKALEDALGLYGPQLEKELREDLASLLSYAKREYLGRR